MRTHERGQATIALVAVVLVAVVVVWGLVRIGEAAVDRAAARTAADAIALAAAHDPASAAVVERWYADAGARVGHAARGGILVERGDAAAAAWAARGRSVEIAPAVVAIAARLEDLVGPLDPRFDAFGFSVAADRGVLVTQLIDDFGLCRRGSDSAGVAWFELC